MSTGFEFVGAGCCAGQDDYGLLCSVGEQGEAYLLRFVYDPRLISAATAANWLEYYGRFLESITEGIA